MHRIYETTILFALIGALLFTSFPVLALSSEGDSGKLVAGTEKSVSTAGVATADTSPDVSAEVVFKRKEFEKHYLLSDGSFMAVVYPEAVHYQEKGGDWEEVDNTLTLSTSTGRITSANKDFQVSFSEKAQAENMVSLQKGSYAFSWSLTAQKAKGAVLASEKLTAQTATILNTETTTKDSFEAPGISSGLRYSNLFASAPEISVVYSVFHNKVEEDIYINSPTDIRSFSMNVTAPGLVAVVKKDGSVEFVDKEGVLQYRVGIPYMLDAKDEVLNDIEVTVEQGKSSFIITYTPNEEWLTAAERAYPIMLDPSITTKEYNSNITDTYVKNGDTANHSAEISIYYGIKSGTLHRGYIKINNLPEINPEMPITEATATFTLKTGTNTGKTAELHRVNQPWDASTITFANAPTSTTLLSSCPFNNSTMTFDLTTNISSMIEGGANNYGYMIKYADESTTNPDYNGYYSTEYTTASKRPVITIKYSYALPDELSVGGVYSFQNVGSGAFMTVDSGMDADATNVYQYNTQIPPLTSKEKFKLEYVSSTGGYLLRAMCSESGTNRVLDIAREGGFVESGCNVQIYRNTDSLAQHWFIVNWSDDEFLLIPRTNMGLLLSAYPSAANGTADGTTATSPGNIYVSTFTGSAYQKWRIIPDGAFDEPYVEITGVANVNEGEHIDLGCRSVPFGLEPEWDSSNPSVATVSNGGRVEGLRAGYTDITVSCTVPSTGELLQATERIYVTIPNGSYFIENRETGKYVQPDNDDGPDYTNKGILEEMLLDVGHHQYWNFTYLGSGYYKITCVKNGYAITVPEGQETVSGPNLVLADYYANWDNQKWRITGTDGGYRISAKCAGPELVMAVQVSDLPILGEPLNIQQKYYVDNNSYKDEWHIIRQDATLVAIPAEVGHDHDATFPVVKSHLRYMGYRSIVETHTMTSEQCILSIASSKIFYSRSHGSQTSIRLNFNWMEIEMINSLEDNFFANCELVYFGACETGKGREGANNLVNAVYAKGARNVIGFQIGVYCFEVNMWSERFFAALSLGMTIEDACYEADEAVRAEYGDDASTESWYIAGAKTNRIFE